jgi:succinate-semialdehyde dehydrogenase/glutarate-semialdehyde dehydrogenase
MAGRPFLVPSDMVEAVIENLRVRAVTLTGSGPAGISVASEAAQQIKKAVLELGGSDAFIVLEDADIDKAIRYKIRSPLSFRGN